MNAIADRKTTLRVASTRCGATIMESAVAAALVAVLLTVLVPFLVSLRAAGRLTAQSQTAVRELGNVLERIAARPPDAAPSADWLNTLPISAAAQADLPNAQLTVTTAAVPDEPAFQELTVSLKWTDDNGRPVAPLSVTTWLPVQEGMD